MIRRLLVVALFAIAIIAPATVTTAATAPVSPQACCVPPRERHTYYYSDATKTVQVGYRFESSCTYENWLEGVATLYYDQWSVQCSA